MKTKRERQEELWQKELRQRYWERFHTVPAWLDPEQATIDEGWEYG